MSETTRPKIYIAGPMQGIKNFNEAAFDIAARYLRNLNYEVFSPIERDRSKYGPDILKSEKGDPADVVPSGLTYREALAADTAWMCKHADAIYMLRGWENSKGAQAEWALARALGLKVMYQ